jgi:hypothetical protein
MVIHSWCKKIGKCRKYKKELRIILSPKVKWLKIVSFSSNMHTLKVPDLQITMLQFKISFVFTMVQKEWIQ